MMESLRIGGMLACLVALGIGACSDDGRVIGERAASGGTSGQAGSGSSGQSGSGGSSGRGGASPTGGSSGEASGGTASNAGTSNAGTAGDATGGDAGAGAGGAGGSSTGGAGGNAGDAGRGGASGGAGSGGGNAGMSGSSGMNCVDRNCSASEACVAHRTIGGAQIRPEDGGGCPSGAHSEGNFCFADFAYQCVAQPGCAAGEVTCTCGTCPQGSPSCRAPYAADWLDPSAKLVCELLAP